MSEEARTPREYAQKSEAHARKVLAAYRHSLKLANKHRELADENAGTSLRAINDAKRVMSENGWTEE